MSANNKLKKKPVNGISQNRGENTVGTGKVHGETC